MHDLDPDSGRGDRPADATRGRSRMLGDFRTRSAILGQYWMLLARSRRTHRRLAPALATDGYGAPNMALQRTRRPRLRSGRSLRSLGSPLNARPLDARQMNCGRASSAERDSAQGSPSRSLRQRALPTRLILPAARHARDESLARPVLDSRSESDRSFWSLTAAGGRRLAGSEHRMARCSQADDRSTQPARRARPCSCVLAPNMALQRTRRPRFRSGRSLSLARLAAERLPVRRRS